MSSDTSRHHVLRPLADGHCLIVGEVGLSHDGHVGIAHAFVDAIADAGAHAVKFQTHIAAAESTRREPWRRTFSRQDRSRYDYWMRTAFTPAQWTELKAHVEARGLAFLSSPFSLEAVELLRDVGVAAWKVASGEVTNLPMLERMAETGLPMLFSTGLSPIADVDRAVACATARGAAIAVLQCTSMYPSPPEAVGLNQIGFFRERYGCPVGLSDHSGRIYAGLAAAALGIAVLETHVTLSREMPGPDVSSSLTPAELAELVEGVRFIEAMRDNPVDKDRMADALAPVRDVFTKSVVARGDLPAGTTLAGQHLALKKPGAGIPPARLDEVIGRRLRRGLKADEAVQFADLEEAS